MHSPLPGTSRSMPPDNLPRRERWAIGAFVFRFPQVHLGIGMLGNALFVIGTVLFLVQQQGVGIWFFLVGSCGMLLGSLGEILRVMGRRRLWRFDVDPEQPDDSWSVRQGRSSAIE